MMAPRVDLEVTGQLVNSSNGQAKTMVLHECKTDKMPPLLHREKYKQSHSH